jgi:hypothetical protein
MDSPLSILGSLASIGAAVWAFAEARRASRAAAAAESMRDEIVHRRRLIEVSQVHADTKRVLIAVSEVGPSTNAKLLRGVDAARIARQVEEYTRSLSEQSAHFTDFFGNEARALCEQLKPDIEKLAEASTPEEKKAAGKSIYYAISAFVSIAKEVADGKREQAPKSLNGN